MDLPLTPFPHTATIETQSETTDDEPVEILKVFEVLPDRRRSAGKRHQATLCLALFTLAVVAGNRGFLAIGDWQG